MQELEDQEKRGHDLVDSRAFERATGTDDHIIAGTRDASIAVISAAHGRGSRSRDSGPVSTNLCERRKRAPSEGVLPSEVAGDC
ncbi:uncharacterized protein PHALS_01893 [Plasmopara halstedii]|uniref:Uncharacterized protein n=1 Tax=Plasmopara halstedii TaxID=4781 RepID=A0A0P1AX42_PLAHL|nr:uncharacterized protein PHALS_01893 [Plasmopara halstedii]CEG45607.1 hypothetical protein PHALS_01893 [Plasmopara halstedii]|eukprot:XP_024581976.1 hypothetical protein PHALS_01893 [Plasmopara halstedii]